MEHYIIIYIGVYDTEFNEKIVKKTDYYVIGDLTISTTLVNFPDFLKYIHLEGETGVFMFYKAETLASMSQNPVILFLTFNCASSLNIFFSSSIISSSVELNYKSFQTSALLNDIIKISNTKICFSSTDVYRE